MTIPGLPTDGPEWSLLKLDLSDDVTGLLKITTLGIPKPLSHKLYIKKNDVGSGEITFSLSDATAAGIQIGNFLSLTYRGAWRGGFLVEKRTLIDTKQDDKSQLAITVSGRGPMALLDDAIVYDWLTPGVENTRKFGVKNPMIPGGPSVPKGQIMYLLLCEARDYRTNPFGNHLRRFCWRAGHLGDFPADPTTPPIGEPLLSWDFTATQDSTPAPVGPIAWTDLEDMEFRVGNTLLLDVMRQIAAIRSAAAPALWYDFTITKEIPTPTTGLFVLHAYAGGIGTDLSDTVHFRVGSNCTEVSRSYVGNDVRNHILIEFSDSNPYTHMDEFAYAIAYRRREGFLQASNASTRTTAQNYGQAQLDASKNTTKDIAMKASDAASPNIFLDYNLGDKIKYDNNSGVEGKYEVTGAQLEWTGDQQYADVTVELD